MGSLTDFPIDQVDSVGVDIEVNNLSDEHFRDVMEELTNHQIPEREKCPLVRRLNASISGYFKSTGDVGFSNKVPLSSSNSNGSSLTGDLPGACGKSNNSNPNNNIGGNQGVVSGSSFEMIELRQTFELEEYRSPKNSSEVKSKSSERTKGSSNNNSSITSATVNSSISSSSSSSSSNSNRIISKQNPLSLDTPVTRVDSFLSFDSLKRSYNERSSESPIDDANSIDKSDANCITTTNSSHNTSSIVTNDNNNNSSRDSFKDLHKESGSSKENHKDNGNLNSTKGNRSTINSKPEKKKKLKKGETVYTAQDIDGHRGDQSIEELVDFVTGNKGEPGNGVNVSGVNVPSVGLNTCNNNNNNVCGSICDNINKLTINPRSNNKDVNVGGKVKKREKLPLSSSSSPSLTSSLMVNNSTGIQGRTKKGSTNNISSSNTIISTSATNNIINNNSSNNINSNNCNDNSVNCASTNGNASDIDVKSFGNNSAEKPNCSVYSGPGKSIPRSSSATTFDSKFVPSKVAQYEVNSSLNASPTSPILSKSHSIESSSSTTTTTSTMQPSTKSSSSSTTHTGNGITVKSKVKEFDTNNQPPRPKELNNNSIHKSESLKSKKSDPKTLITNTTTSTANGDPGSNYLELGYAAASDSEIIDSETSFQTVKSKHFKRRKNISKAKGDLRITSTSSSRSSNTIFTNSSSSSTLTTTPSITSSSTSNSVNTSMTARGYESEREYCADEYRSRKDYLTRHRKLASSMPHSEQNSADNSDLESSCSYPVSGRMPILPTPPGPPASSNTSISSTPKVSYADVAKIGSIIGATPSVGMTKGPSPTNITLNSNNNNVKDANNNISCTTTTTTIPSGSTETSPKNTSTVDSGLSISLQTHSSSSTSCSPNPVSSPNCVSPSESSHLSSSGQTLPTEGLTKKGKTLNQISKPCEKITTPIDLTSQSIIQSIDNPPTIKSESNVDQEISSSSPPPPPPPSSSSSSKPNVGPESINPTTKLAAVTSRTKEFDIFKETKTENQKVIAKDTNNNVNANNKNPIKAKNDKTKLDKTSASHFTPSSSSSTTASSTPSSSSSTLTVTSTPSNPPSNPNKPSATSSSTTTLVTKPATKLSSHSKTLEALLSPPAEKTPTFDMKKENSNKLSDTRVASVKSDTSRASALRKSNSIPGAHVKTSNYSNSTNNNHAFRVTLNESNTSSENCSSPSSSLPPVIMNDDSDATDDIESSFTFGFFDDVSSTSPSNQTIKNMSSASTKTASASTKATTSSSTTTKTSNYSGIGHRSTPTTTTNTSTIIPTPAATVNNKNNHFSSNDNVKHSNVNHNNHSSSRVKPGRNVTTSSSINPTFSTTTTTTTLPVSSVTEASSTPPPATTKTTTSSKLTTGAASNEILKPLEAVSASTSGGLQGKKSSSGKDPTSTSGKGNNAALGKFNPIKLIEPPSNLDADITTFNYGQIISFIKTAWESVMCQYNRSPDVTLFSMKKYHE